MTPTLPFLPGAIAALPVTDPVLIVGIAMGVMLVVPMLFERIQIPGIIGLLVAGAALGPHGLNVLARDATMVLLGTVGLLYLVFLAGLELDLHRFAEYRTRSLVFGAFSFGIPMLLAVAFMPLLGFGLPASLLLGSIIGSHTLLAYPIVSRLGLAKNTAVTTVVGGTLVTDTLALGVLAVIAGSAEGGLGAGFLLRLVGTLAVYVGLVLWGVPRLGHWFFRKLPGQAPAEFIFLMVVLFASAYLAGLAGAQPIIGAFLAGLALNRLIPENSPLMNRTQFIGSTLFIPFFLLSVGMLVDTRVLAGSLRVWLIAGAILVLVNVGKLAGAWVTRWLYGYDGDETILMFGLSVPQAAATLAVTFVGLEIGLFGETVVNAVIVMILVTCLLGPTLVERFGRRVALHEEQQPYTPREAPQRILIPLANPSTAEGLMDIAFILRDPRSDEPLYPLMVAREDEAGRTEEQVAEAEKMLGHAVIYGASAEVPVVPLTRLDRNIATGIVRGVNETRSSLVIVGWDGRAASRQGIFGSVLDQVLEHTGQMVMVVKLGHPLNTTRRIVTIVPPWSDHQPGFYDAARNVKLLASGLGASLLCLRFSEDGADYPSLLQKIQPLVPTRYEALPGWEALPRTLRQQVEDDDLVVVLSARRGTLPWHPKLERLPEQLARLLPESFLIIYPSEADTPAREATLGSLPRGLRPERVTAELPRMPYEKALRQILRKGFTREPRHLEEIIRVLVRGEQEFSTEVRPGVVVPHARVHGIEEPILFLGVSAEGIDFPSAKGPAHLIFVLLSPAERPQEHLRSLAEIARLVSHEESVRDLLGRYLPPDAKHKPEDERR